jgi:molybdate transport system ATP-binding protein
MSLSASIATRLPSGFALDLELTAAPGFTILFGASGSGKTTLLRSLAGLVTPERGRIMIRDRVVFDASTGVNLPPPRRQIGYVFQQLALFPHLTVATNIGYGLAGLPPVERRARIAAIAASFRIEHLLARRPGAISGGERQRVALARALVTRPDLLLLDEPLSALDYQTQSRIITDLRAWHDAQRIPILYVTHSHREVFALGERVVVLEQGRRIADGPPHEVMHGPAQESVASLAGFENFLDATVAALKPESGTMECRLTGHLEIEVPYFAVTPGLAIRLAIRAGDIMLASEAPRGLSARNLLPGIVRSLRQDGTTVVVIVDAGHPFEVHITPGARASLGLAEGRSVWLVIKTHSFRRVDR